jgi:putative phosphoribosyl transferase
MPPTTKLHVDEHPILVRAGETNLEGDLVLPHRAPAIVALANDVRDGRLHAHSKLIASALNDVGFATLSLDLATPDERDAARATRGGLEAKVLGDRLASVLEWILAEAETRELHVGILGVGSGVAAAMIAAAHQPPVVGAVVVRGGRPHHAGEALEHITAPTLLVVGGGDASALASGRRTMRRMTSGQNELVVVPNAGRAFAESGALEQTIWHAQRWFTRHLGLGTGVGT